MEELVQIFLEESQELLQQLENDLLELEKSPGNREVMDRIFRAAHTIKGSAGLTGLDEISSLAHRMEDVLDNVRQTGCIMGKQCFDVILKAMDMLNKMVEAVSTGEDVPQGQVEEIKESLAYFLKTDVSPAGFKEAEASAAAVQPGKTVYKVGLKFREDIFESGTDPLRLIKELAGKGVVRESLIGISRVPELGELDPYKMLLNWTVFLETEMSRKAIEDVFVFVWDDNEISIEDITADYYSGKYVADKLTGEILLDNGLIDRKDLEESLGKQPKIGEILVQEAKVAPRQVEKLVEEQQKAREQEQINTIRVDTRRLEGVLNYIAELVITQSRVKELVYQQNLKDTEIINGFQEVDKVVRLLQEEVMKTTMIPIGNTFTRFQRMVRDLADDAGKEIELKIYGKDTELDKRVIEQITDPLKHMIRNSVDHGIEPPAERTAKGKPGKGTIVLNAYHQEGSIIIEVSDDGRGIDGEAVFRKAVEKGLVPEDARLTNEQMQKLLFMPGFSTAEKITDISGRGVGLDVVITNIKSLRGHVDIESEKDKGTRFIIKLPLTLAIIDGMMVTIGRERFIIPLTSIIEFIKAGEGDIKSIEGRGMVIKVRNEYIPLVPLYRILQLPADKTDPTDGLLVIIRDGKKKMALLVDEILGQEQVVTKSMKENFEQIEGVAGATILGDGKVALILDVSSITRIASRLQYNTGLQGVS